MNFVIKSFEQVHIYKFIERFTLVNCKLLCNSLHLKLTKFCFFLSKTGEKPFVCDVCNKRFRVRGDLKRHSNIHERNKVKEIKIDEISNSSNNSNSTKTDLFTLDDNNTLHSRTTDTLDQLVSVIENTDATFTDGNSNESMKKRNFSHFDYEKGFSKSKFKRDTKVTNNSTDYLVINYSSDSFINKSSLTDNDHTKEHH